jgi:hypothetical protein
MMKYNVERINAHCSFQQDLSRHTSLHNRTRVEAGSNTSSVTLRVVRGDEMGLKKAAP